MSEYTIFAAVSNLVSLLSKVFFHWISLTHQDYDLYQLMITCDMMKIYVASGVSLTYFCCRTIKVIDSLPLHVVACQSSTNLHADFIVRVGPVVCQKSTWFRMRASKKTWLTNSKLKQSINTKIVIMLSVKKLTDDIALTSSWWIIKSGLDSSDLRRLRQQWNLERLGKRGCTNKQIRVYPT